jgi:hypothetical protein
VAYGLTTAYGSSSTLITTLTTSHSVNLTGLSPGTTYHYQVKSRDSFNNLGVSGDSTFPTPLNPDTTNPNISITNPSSSGQTVSGTITFGVSASDPAVPGQVTSGIFSVTLYIDGSVFASSTNGNYSINLDTTTLTNQTHTLTAMAKDNAGNTGSSQAVTIIVYNLSNAQRYPRKFTLAGGLQGLPAVPANTPVTATVVSVTNGTTLETQTISPDASQNYSVTFLATDPQVVNVRIKVSGYLSQLTTNLDTTVNSPTAIALAQLLAGDFNNDNIVNSLDYSLMNTHWLQNYATADINGDGLVNSLDYAIFKNNFNVTGQ